MNLEDYTPEQRAEWHPRQRQWYAVWKNNASVQAGEALLASLMTIDAEVTNEEDDA